MNAVPYRSVLHIVFDRKENNEVLEILPFKAELKSLSTLDYIMFDNHSEDKITAYKLLSL